MPLAKNLNDLIHRFGGAIAHSAEAVLQPRHNPGDPLPDLSELEKCRSAVTGRPFSFFESQRKTIAGVLAGLKATRRVWLVADCGVGKTAMSLAAAWSLLKNRPFRALVMAPSHIVLKWQREVEALIPRVYCRIIRRLGDLLKFVNEAKFTDVPAVAIISKEAAKLGFDLSRNCATKRKVKLLIRLESRNEMLPDDKELREIPSDSGTYIEVSRIIDAACCPRCGHILQESDEDPTPISHAAYLAGDEPKACTTCGDKLTTNARGFRKNPHLDRFIQRKLRKWFSIFLADEVHELAGCETEQGNSFGTLTSSCKYSVGLSGTILNGAANSLHATLWRMSPRLLNQRGFSLRNLRASRISAIARNERAFLQRYGVLEYKIVRNIADDFTGRIERGACGRRKSYKTDERPRPGINPNLFNHFMLERAAFLNIEDLGPALPPLERILVPCLMSEDLKDAYNCLDGELRDAIKQRVAGRPKGPPGLAATRVQALDAYVDSPFDWQPISAPVYDENGRSCGTENVAWPVDLGENHLDSKDTKLVEIVRAELKQGRRVAVYVQFVGKHDVRPKLLKVLGEAGIRVTAMPDTVKPEARETWLEKHVEEMDALIVNPKRVCTGLDLLAFPSLLFFQIGLSTFTLRQASARARRPAQTQPCKVFYLYYAGTIQEQALALMGEKEAASHALEGTFDTNALRTMMNGGENDDILATLANQLEAGKKLDARVAWNVTKPKKKTPVFRVKPHAWQHEFLFDMNFAPTALAASGE